MNPNYYLAAAIAYLYANRPHWRDDSAVGKTVVSQRHDRPRRGESWAASCIEVPVGFKWFATGLIDGSLGFGGEESAGASFLRRDGSVWTTDKDGLILGLLAAEITAQTGKDPQQFYDAVTQRSRQVLLRAHRRAGDAEQKDALTNADAGEARRQGTGRRTDQAKFTKAPGNNAADRRHQGDHARTAGSPRGRPAPKTSTRSTPKASKAKII